MARRRTRSPKATRPRTMAAAQELMELVRARWPSDADRKIAVVRLLILFALLPLMWWDIVSPDTKQVLIGLTALFSTYILAALFIFPRVRRIMLRRDLFLTIDILAVTALVWFTGGINSSLLFLFYLPILAAAIRLELREAILSAVAVSGIVIWMWNVAEGGLPSLGSTTLRVGLFSGSSLVLATIFGIMAQESRQLRDRAEANRELNDRLVEATEQLRRRLSELEFAYDLSRRLATAGDTKTVMGTVTDAARQLLQAPYGAVLLLDYAATEFHLAHASGISDRDALPLVRGCAVEVTAKTTDPVTVEVAHPAIWTRAVCAPILLAGRLVGVLCAGGNETWHPVRHSVAVVGHIASQAAIALDRASLLEDLQRLAVLKPEARLFTPDQFDTILRDEISRATHLTFPLALLKLILTVDRVDDGPPESPTIDLASKRVTEVVLRSVRRIDVVGAGARGELFVLLSMANLTGAKKFATRLLQDLRYDDTLKQLLGAHEPNLRAGIARFPDDAVAAPELLYAAQNAVEAANAQQLVVCASELDRQRPAVEESSSKKVTWGPP